MRGAPGLAAVRSRLPRDAAELVVLVAMFAMLHPAGFLAGPLALYVALGVLATVLISAAHALCPADCGQRRLHLRFALQVPPLVALAYATGWGPVMAAGFAFLVADNINFSGSRAARPATWWCLAGILTGQMAIVFGWAPTFIPSPGVHGAAALSSLCFALVAHRIARLSREKEEALLTVEAREDRFRTLVQNSSDVMLVAGADNRLTYISPSVHRVFGYEPSELEGRVFLDLLHPDDLTEIKRFTAEVVSRPAEMTLVECRLRHANGTWREVETVGNNLLDDPNVSGFVLNTRDVTEQKALEGQLQHRAFHDALTNLANRALFQDRAEHALARQSRRQEHVAILYLDLDGFKAVNDTLGHAAGDALLLTVSRRLLDCIREVDTAARLGGDEFAILLEDVSDESGPARVASRVLEELRRPFLVRGQSVHVDASIGIAVHAASAPPVTAEEFIRNADVAMYMAKNSGKGRYEIFEPSMHVAVVDRLEVESALRRAVDRREFLLHYQPIVELDSGTIVGLEALIRWQHPQRGMVAPNDFIPLAEETGLIVPIGRWVLGQACQDMRMWQDRYDTHPPLHVSVNLSTRQLTYPGIVDDVADALERSGIDPATLTLEITETALVQDTEVTIERLGQLKELGVRVAVDDFGTGYSSLSYLQRFPVDVLKIDRSFINGIDRDAANPALLRAIVELGRSLELETVAEGIERQDQLAQFREMRCQHGQGFLFARPTNAEAISALFAQQGWAAPRRAAPAELPATAAPPS